jgi:hypothetical protein
MTKVLSGADDSSPAADADQATAALESLSVKTDAETTA